jgi:predicted CopG family antitoxin
MSMQTGCVVSSKNIAIRMDIIEKLDRAKRPGESYSDVIERYVGDRTSLLEVVKYLREHPMKGKDTLTPIVRQIRREANESARRRMKRFEEMP